MDPQREVENRNGEVATDDSAELSLFESSLSRFKLYPANLMFSEVPGYQLKDYQKLLDDNKSGLFSTETVVDFLEFQKDRKGKAARDACFACISETLIYSMTGPQAVRARDLARLEEMGIYNKSYNDNPACRFM